MDEEGGGARQSHHGGEVSHVCDKCCAEFSSWAELCEHQRGCTEEDPLVLIVKEDQEIPIPEEVSPAAGPSPAPSPAPSDHAYIESETDRGFDLVATVNDDESSDMLEERKEDEGMELEQQPQNKQHKHQTSSLPQPPDSTESISPKRSTSTVSSYSMPTSTNVTLEILQSTRVAVAQFSQDIHDGGGRVAAGGKAATAAIPVILEHLLALQQQQVHQLQLIEQIRSQVAVMNKQPVQTALNPVSRALAIALPTPFPPSQSSLITTPVLPLSGTMPSAVNGQASVSLASVLERSQMLSSQTVCGSLLNFRDASSSSRALTSSTFSEGPAAPPLSSSGSNNSTAPPSYSHSSVIGSTQTLSSSSPLSSLGQSSRLSSSSSLPFLPQSPPSSVIFPNPLASIAATANALDPLAALLKHRKGKPPNVSVFDPKPGPEEPFFKHKCRFCAKVFGSDSALQIHLRSHTGERPFKCNICGNRFSTKGNLKVHFQRHKEKYPHVQMNPYPVPEYLDNVPTNSGIPYGMSFPPEKPGSTWLDSKPVLATMPTPVALQLPSSLTGVGNSNDFLSVTPSIKSPYRPASSECASLSPKSTNTEPNVPLISESPRPESEVDFYNVAKPEEVHLPQNCSTRPRRSPINTTLSMAPITTGSTPQPSAPPSPVSVASPPSLTSDPFKARFPFGGPLDSMQTSETSKLQQLVENIDRKITDPNQCVLCHRVLSCQSALKMHYRIHTGERPFKCKVCGRAFTTKGNLKTHFGVHRANPPLRVQHSCPICQKRFTNAVVLQQHIRMHMGGHIPNSLVTPTEGLHEMDSNVNQFFDEKNADSPSSHENDFMDENSMEEEDEEEEDEETENMEEEGGDPFKPLCSLGSSPPKSSAVVSSIAALENQMRMIDSTVSLNHSFGIKSLMKNGFVDGSNRFTFTSSLKAASSEDQNAGSPAVSESSCSVSAPASPSQSTTEGHHHLSRSPELNHRVEIQETAPVSVKNEQGDSPTLDLRGTQPNKPSVKEENPYSMMFLSREWGPHQSMPSLVPSPVLNPVKTEVNGHSRPTISNDGHHHHHHHHYQPGLQVPAAYTSVGSPGLSSLLVPAPPRRTPKQHNCNACGKNFSSASALQIHERTHTGEKPFGCSICGRAFTTKGNLKVHMGTHMWNNAPARRGRRLSVENPMALLGGEALKFGEMFQKDLAARAMNVDAGFWNRYAAAITNGLAMKNNEISVIQNGGINQLHAMAAGMERANAGRSPPMSHGLGKTGLDLGSNRHFSMLIDDSKEIGIN